MRKRKYIFLFLTVLAISIGYALISTDLFVRVSNRFMGNTWDIHFENIRDESLNVNPSLPVTTSQNRQEINYTISLDNPRDKFVFYTDVVNNGTLDVMLNSLQISGISEELEDLLLVKVTYNDGIKVQRYDMLGANSRDTIRIETLFREDIDASDLSEETINTNIVITLNYQQADEYYARERINTEESNEIANLVTFNTSIQEQSINVEVSNNSSEYDFYKYFYSMDGGETYTYSYSPTYQFSSLEENDYDITVYAEDVLGNRTNTKTLTIPITHIYAMLYTDGTLVFNRTGDLDSNKTLDKKYENIENTHYTSSSQVPWYSDRSKIVVVDFEETIKPVSTAYWFYGTNNLTTVLHGSNLETKSVTDMAYMFNNDNNLTTLNVSDWNTSSVTNMAYMFRGCSSLTTLNTSEWNTSSLTSLDYMFNGCSSLTSLDLSKWDVSKVTYMSYVFKDCSGLETLDVSKWNVSKVTNMYHLFDGCSSLTTIDVSKWDVSRVSDMGNMFQNCSSLTTLDVSKWNVSNNRYMDYMFDGCSSLISLDVSDWNVSNVNLMESTFRNAKKLETLDLSKWDTRGVSSFGSMFAYTSQEATSKIIYYGENSMNMYNNRGTENIYATFTYKEND